MTDTSFCLLQVRDDLLASLIELKALCGWADAPRSPIKQPHSQLLLKPQYGGADRRSGNTERSGRLTKIPRFNDAQKNQYAMQAVDGGSPIINDKVETNSNTIMQNNPVY
jgi:hypothetical protein